ncbi:carboxymuconolactone decarboxylase family protein [Parasphingorhabdus litoris]|uniref:Carboxymuconolactone decarboxylase family protein n=1 Tax=Parasphingorhabdus litoris TaxID=394733 RepID=A0ABN1A090_9SPHN|nr:carboxymuconolactone decarboxylase family protein [Parasphingorhabdus litoris]
MQRINQIDTSVAPAETAELLAGVKSSMGMIPNIIATMANSKPVLEAYLALSGTLAGATISNVLAEQIALAVAGANRCDYCASAHMALGAAAGIDEEERTDNLRGSSSAPKTKLVLDFVNEVIRTKGRVSDTSLVLMHSNGFSDAEILEIFGHVMLNMFTNYFNHLVGTEIDFPVVNTQDALAA